MNKAPLIKCACMFCDCDLAIMEGVCYECTRGLHALNEWKDGYKVRMQPPIPPIEHGPDIRPQTRSEELWDLLQDVKKFAIMDMFDGKKCSLCGRILHFGLQKDKQHDNDCPILKIDKLEEKHDSGSKKGKTR